MPPVESLVFTALCLAMAGVVWHARLPSAQRRWTDGLGLFLPAAALLVIVAIAAIDGRGTRLSASLTELRVPETALEIDAPAREVLRVGDRADHADLVVRPYLDWRLNRVSMAEEPRINLRLFARRDEAAPERIEASLAVQDYPASTELDLPGMKITGHEGLPVDPQTGRKRLDPGQSVTLVVRRDDSHEDPGKKPVARRTFTIRNLAGSAQAPAALVVTPQDPLTTSAGNCQQPRATLQPAASEDAARMNYLDPQDLVFGDLGAGGYDGALLASAQGGSVFGRAAACAKANQTLHWPASGARARSFTFRFSYLTIPWMLPLLFLSSVLAYWFFGREALARSRAERIIVPLLFTLLAIRVLVSMGAAVADASIEPQTFFRDAALSLILMPPAMAALLRPHALARQGDWLMLLAVAAGQFAALKLWLPGTAEPDQIALAVLALGAVALRLLPGGSGGAVLRYGGKTAGTSAAQAGRFGAALTLALARTLRPLGQGAARAMQRLWTWLPRPISSALAKVWQFCLDSIEPYRRSPLLRIGVMLLLLDGLARIALRALFGAKERLFEKIPLSPPYLAVLILGCACITIGLLRLRSHRRRAALPVAAALFIAIPAAMVLVNDTGFAFVHLLPLCAVCFCTCLSGWKPGSTHRRSAATIAFGLPVLGLVLAIAASAGWAIYSLADRPLPLAEQMARTIAISPNDARLVQLFAPGMVERIGTAAGFEQMEQTAMLHSLSGSLMGEGFLHPVKLLSIRKEQTWDYVAAVHIMRPYGRIGAVALIAVLFAFACAITAQGGPPPHDPGTARRAVTVTAARLAAWSFFAVGAYMVLANLLFVPFTGRSIYLIATLSTGDLIEAALLLAIAALAIAPEDR